MTITSSRLFSFLLAFSFGIGCSSTSSTAVVEVAASAPQSDTTKLESNPPTAAASSTSSAAAVPELPGCELNWKREARVKALNAAVEKSDLDTQNVKDGFVNSTQRNRLAILSAGLIPDDIPFVSLDRSCWSEFYRAHQSLRDGNERLAKKAAEGWRTCLGANFPERSKQAQRLYSCFGLSPKDEDDGTAEGSED
jgi:hypothetical protein